MEEIQIVWIVLVVVFMAAEAATVGLTSIWFAAGALAALLVSFAGAVEWIQILLFFVVSIAALVFTRPLAAKFVNARVEATNADKIIGATAVVTEKIDNVAGTGTASVSGRMWTARSEDGRVIETGEQTVVKAIQGVKIIVAPMTVHVG